MSGRALLVLLLLLAAAVLSGWLLWFGGGDPAPQPPAGQSPPGTLPSATAQTHGGGAAVPGGGAAPAQRTAVASGQGFVGRLVASTGEPVAGAQLFVFPMQAAPPPVLLAMAARGRRDAPLASAVSEADGGFRIAVGDGGLDRRLELRIVHDDFVDRVRPALLLAAGAFRDLGPIALERGLVVHGQVRDAGSGAPLPGAVVALQPRWQRPQAMPTPGREDGRTAVTDAEGRYRFANAPAGLVGLRATAPGHASRALPQQMVQAGEDNVFDFELGVGAGLAGSVHGEAGPLADAVVEAGSPQHPEVPRARVRSRADGSFVLDGLEPGECELQVGAVGYQLQTLGPLPTGSTGVRVELQRQGGLRLQVRAGGRPLTGYTAAVRGYDQERDRHDALHGEPARQVGAADLRDGVLVWHGFDPGTYAVEVEAAGWAKAFSAPFTLTGPDAMADVQVELVAGAVLRGVVVDADGRPLAGAVLTTLPGAGTDNAAQALFAALLVDRSSRTRVVADAAGVFLLPHLAAADYQLRIEHPAAAPRWLRLGLLAADADRDLGRLVMPAGARVQGTVRLDGASAAQVHVQWVALTDGALPRGNVQEAESDADGRWRLPQRVPAGRYELSAWRSEPIDRARIDAEREQTRTAVTVGEQDGERSFDLALRSMPRGR